jgi:hypothetical protein
MHVFVDILRGANQHLSAELASILEDAFVGWRIVDSRQVFDDCSVGLGKVCVWSDYNFCFLLDRFDAQGFSAFFEL